jgi:hypothetical protein
MRLHPDRLGQEGFSPPQFRTPPPTPAPSRPPKSLASGSTWKPGSAAGAVRKTRS